MKSIKAVSDVLPHREARTWRIFHREARTRRILNEIYIDIELIITKRTGLF
jgi:hypothetical protein